MLSGQQTVKFLQRLGRAIQTGRVLQTGIPWLRQRGIPLPMSSYAYAFDRFKRERLTMVPTPDLSAVVGQGSPGLVSIVLPAYNGEGYIEAALESILSQTYDHWELIAVDDGSTDRTGEILDEYSQKDPRVQVVHQGNRKLPGALKTGFDQAQGEFLTWTSVDNLLYPEFLHRMVSCLQRHPGWDMVYANLDVIGEDGAPLRESDWYRSYQVPLDSEHIHLPRDPSELNTRPDNYLGAAFLYRSRAAVLLGAYSPYHYTIEDYDYWMRLNALMALSHADFSDPLYAYRFHSRSLTSRDRELAITERRNKLIVFDSFRRDFYLSPLLWGVEAGNSSEEVELAASFKELLNQYGHVLLDLGEVDAAALPHLWFPLTYVFVSENPVHTLSPPPNLPSNAFRILVKRGQCTHASFRDPVTADSGWDLCVLYGEEKKWLPGGVPAPYQLAVSDNASLLTALDVWVRSRHLAVYEAEVAHPTLPTLKASVVICTYKRPERLEAALKSIAAQDFPRQDFEVLIVNNDPQPGDVQALTARWQNELFADDPERLRLVHCPIVGLSYARNAGISEARGEIVCFLDDDALAAPDWLEWILAAYEHNPRLGVVGGKILLKRPEPAPRWMLPGWEVYWSHFDPPEKELKTAQHWSHYPWGANWTARKAALLEAGGFPARGFGRKGGKIQDGEEIAAAAMVQKMGYDIGVEPRATVIHAVDPARFTFRFVWNKIFRSRWRWYQSQVDLYLPGELGLRHAWSRIRSAISPLRTSVFLKAPYILLAEAMTFFWVLRDWVKRLRKPVAMR